MSRLLREQREAGSGKRIRTHRYASRFPLPVFLALLLACRSGPPAAVAFVGATVFDGTDVTPNATIVVHDGHIEQIGPANAVEIPRGAPSVRLDGKWVVPGLIDGHAHAERWALPRYLAYGVTSLRDVGGNTDTLVAMRSQIASGVVPGPRLFIAGAMLDGSPRVWSDAIELTSTADAVRAVADLAHAKVSQIKLYVHTPLPIMEMVVREATAYGLPVTAHLGRVDALSAARAGVRSGEHLSGVVEASVRDPRPYFAAHERFLDGWKAFLRGWGTLDSAALDRTAAALVALRFQIVPTLIQSETYARLDDTGYANALDLSGVPAEVRSGWNLPDLLRRGRFVPADFAAFRRSRPMEDLFVRRYRARGGIVVAGSDSPNQLLAPGASLQQELRLLVLAGLTPLEALRAATVDAARMLQTDSVGVLKKGAVADFVVLSADPLADISNVSRIEQVVIAGQRHSAGALRSAW